MKIISKLFLSFVGLTTLLLALSFILTSCTCESEGDDADVNDDTDNDDTDNDTDDDDDDAQDWHIYTIDTEPPYNTSTSIVIDSKDKVHISYQDHRFGDTKGLKYATNKYGTWQKFILDPYGAVPSLAIDSNDKLHISYNSGCSDIGCIKYATNKSGTWQTSVAAEIGDADEASNNSIDVDSNGKVHIAIHLCGEFTEEDGCSIGNLEYATNQSGAWQIVKVDSTQRTGKAPSIALDSNNKVHISYYTGRITGDLKYATNASKGWQKFVIDTGATDFFVDSNIDVDKDGKVHISYYDNSAGPGYSYATNATGTWQISVIESTGYVYEDNSLALDSDGKVHISYVALQGDDLLLKYATNKSGDWEITTIAKTEGGIYDYIDCTSIALDSEGYVHISYIAAYPDVLKYATNRPPE